MPLTSDKNISLVSKNTIFSASRTGHFCYISCLHKMMITYQYELLNTINSPNELVMKRKTMTLTQYLPFQNCHLPTLRTGQSGLTYFFCHSESHYSFIWQPSLKKLFIVKLQSFSVLITCSLKFLSQYQVLK